MTLLATLKRQSEERELTRRRRKNRLIRARNYIKMKARFNRVDQILTRSVTDELDEMIKELEA